MLALDLPTAGSPSVSAANVLVGPSGSSTGSALASRGGQKNSPAREGRNPSTGETIKIAASRKLGFTVAKAVKDKLNG